MRISHFQTAKPEASGFIFSHVGGVLPGFQTVLRDCCQGMDGRSSKGKLYRKTLMN